MISVSGPSNEENVGKLIKDYTEEVWEKPKVESNKLDSNDTGCDDPKNSQDFNIAEVDIREGKIWFS